MTPHLMKPDENQHKFPKSLRRTDIKTFLDWAKCTEMRPIRLRKVPRKCQIRSDMYIFVKISKLSWEKLVQAKIHPTETRLMKLARGSSFRAIHIDYRSSSRFHIFKQITLLVKTWHDKQKCLNKSVILARKPHIMPPRNEVTQISDILCWLGCCHSGCLIYFVFPRYAMYASAKKSTVPKHSLFFSLVHAILTSWWPNPQSFRVNRLGGIHVCLIVSKFQLQFRLFFLSFLLSCIEKPIGLLVSALICLLNWTNLCILKNMQTLQNLTQFSTIIPTLYWPQ